MSKNRQPHIAIALCLLTCISSGYAREEEPLPSAEDGIEYRQLLELLEEQTTIATKTRLNADYVPGMVTVLHGGQMEDNGSRTVWEALAKVPGIDLAIEETGRKQIVVRGIGRTYASGNVKLMLNGMSMNTAQIGYASAVFDIPTEQVERIEIIRGPGSAIHGEYAYAGVVNIITRTNDSGVFIRAAEGQHRGVGGLYSYRDPEGDLMLDLNLSHWAEDGLNIIAGEDDLYRKDIAQLSNAPGPTNEKQQQKNLFLTLSKADYRLNLQWLENGYGDHFGINDYLPPDEKRIVTQNLHQSLEMGKRTTHTDHLESDIYLTMRKYEEEKDDLFLCYPSTIYLDDEDFVCNSDDMLAAFGVSWDPALGPLIVDSLYREERTAAGLSLMWKANKQHQVLMAYELSETTTRKNDKAYGQSGGEMLEFGLIEEDTSRRLNSLTLQDEYRPLDTVTLTLGLRRDNYDDIGVNTSPRIAAVYRLERKHIFKVQYASAFRPPTFYEMAGKVEGDTIDPATIDTYESGYTYKGHDNDLKLTLFYSDLQNPITFIDEYPVQGYTNVDNTIAYGSEVEWEYRFGLEANLYSNLSYLQTNDKRNDEPVTGSSDWLANLGINYPLNERSQINLHYRYVGEVHRDSADERSDTDSYSTVDATYNYKPAHAYTLRFGVKNMFDNDITYPAPADTYPEDRPRPGRYWWGSMSYQF